MIVPLLPLLFSSALRAVGCVDEEVEKDLVDVSQPAWNRREIAELGDYPGDVLPLVRCHDNGGI